MRGWTLEMLKQSVVLYREGHPETAIAKAVGIPRPALMLVIDRKRDLFLPRPDPRAETVEKIHKLWREQKTGKEIAAILGIPYGHVYRLVARYRDRFGRRYYPRDGRIPILPELKVGPPARNTAGREPQVMRLNPPAPVKMENSFQSHVDARLFKDEMPAEGEPVPLLMLTGRRCRWPVAGEGCAMLFCGGRLNPADRSYCGEHSKLAYRKPAATDRLREPHNDHQQERASQ